MAGILNPFGERADPVYNPETPYEQDLSHPYMVHISGVPTDNPERFNVNFDCEGSDIAFHFDVRFNYGGDGNVVVRNAKVDDSWGSEERDTPCFPFEPNQFFDMVIVVYPSSFKVAVNNQPFVDFHHRIPDFCQINKLRIKGDVKICQIRVQ